jgi:hypothetical protein
MSRLNGTPVDKSATQHVSTSKSKAELSLDRIKINFCFPSRRVAQDYKRLRVVEIRRVGRSAIAASRRRRKLLHVIEEVLWDHHRQVQLRCANLICILSNTMALLYNLDWTRSLVLFTTRIKQRRTQELKFGCTDYICIHIQNQTIVAYVKLNIHQFKANSTRAEYISTIN